MFDPLDPYDPLGLIGQANRPYQPARPQAEPLSPAEEDSLLARIGHKALGGIGYVGSVLEKTFGGRAIRGALGGRPRELLSVIPGSDTLGITDEADRVSGKELLGLHDDSWGSTLAGIGAELALDPGMYMTFGSGALTGAGRIAQKAGVLPTTTAGRVGTTLSDLMTAGNVGQMGAAASKGQAIADALAASGKTLAEVAHEPLGYSVGFGLPFMHPVAGLGEAGLDIARGARSALGALDSAARSVPVLGGQYGHLADAAGTALDWLGRHGRALFQPEVMGATTHLGQEAAREASGAVPRLVQEARMRAAGYADRLKAAGVDPTGEVLRAVAEGTHAGPVHPEVQAVAQAMRQDLQQTLQQLQSMGVDVNQLSDLAVDYLPRYQTPLTRPTGGAARPRQPLSPVDPRVQGREPILHHFTGGTAGINQMVLDPEVYAGTPMEAAAVIRRKYLSPQLDEAAALDQSNRLADWVRGLDPQYRASAGTASPLRYFSNHPLADYTSYYDRAARLQAAAEATHGLIGRTALEASANLPAGALRLNDALEAVGLKQLSGAQQTALARINAERAAQGLAPLAHEAAYVPGETVKEAGRYLQGFRAPEAVGAVGGALDWLTNLTKAFQTAPFPAFHLRNLVSGLWQNWVKGANEAPGGMLKQVQDAYRLIGGEALPDAAQIADYARRGLTPEQATRELAREMYAWGVGGHMPHLSREVLGPAGQAVNAGTDLDAFLARIPGEQPRTVTGALATAAGRAPGQSVSWNPLDVAGANANADLFPPVAGGRQLGDVVEGVNRGSLYLALRRQGFAPEQAAREVLGAHFDYTRGALTDFEASVMRRLVPFYRYTRSNIPFQLEQLVTRPGGEAAALARAAQDLRSDTFLPDYLGAGLAVPVGAEEGGQQRYLTRLDLPPEQMAEWLHGGPRWFPNTLMGLLAQTNPALKAGVEYATNKQFYTGRSLDDLHSMTGVPLAEAVLMNSPLSRAATTLRTLADERKWQDPWAVPLNLGTGVRLTDVDLDKQRNVAAREYVRDVLAGLPEVSKFETLYVRPELRPYLTPAETELLRLQKTVDTRAQEEARKKQIRVLP